MINPNYANPILTLANGLTENGIPFTINEIWDGLQIRFPWNYGDFICHSYSYGSDKGMVESMGCPWDDDDVTALTVEDALKYTIEWYNVT